MVEDGLEPEFVIKIDMNAGTDCDEVEGVDHDLSHENEDGEDSQHTPMHYAEVRAVVLLFDLFEFVFRQSLKSTMAV